MPFRQLPRTNAQRISALDGIADKWASTEPEGRLFPQPLLATMLPLRGAFKQEVGEAAAALGAQTRATTLVELRELALDQHISHFIQVLTFAIARGVHDRADRAYYQLDVSAGTVPDLHSHADRVRWAQNIVAGEAARLAAAEGAPGLPMSNPSAADVEAALEAYIGANRAQSTAKDAFDSEEEDIPELHPAVDGIIREIWDHIEFALRAEPGPSRRRKAREWGLAYVARPGEAPEEGVEPAPVE